ncbi:2-methoxy-6-polyprenyl-1,4-benzoquinol methylase mitochondrial-like, partial [Trifolium pratense]
MALGAATKRLGNKLFPALSATPRLLHSHATSFGFKHVNEEEKARMVGDVFTSVAASYDTMNDLMSAGLHRLWKERLVSMLNPFPGMKKHLVVDGGTALFCLPILSYVENLRDVDFRILDNINRVKQRGLPDGFNDALESETRIHVCDINPNMLNVGKQRAAAKGEDGSLVWVEGNAESLSFQNDSMDGYTIAFRIRNVTHIEKVLSEAH